MIGTIRSKLDDWRRQLLDLTKRNPLVNTKIGRRSGIEIEYPAPDAVWQQLVLDNSALTFVWNRDLVEDEADEGSAELSLYIEDEETPAAPCAPRTLDRCLASPDLKEHHVLTQLTDRAVAPLESPPTERGDVTRRAGRERPVRHVWPLALVRVAR